MRWKAITDGRKNFSGIGNILCGHGNEHGGTGNTLPGT